MMHHPLNPNHFDYLFVGLGAANSLLLLQLHVQNNLKDKKIAVIEPNEKNENDRTFCFWSTQDELTRLQLENLVHAKWSKIKVSGRDEQSISPKKYYCIKSIDLYNQTKAVLKNYPVRYFKDHLHSEPRKIEQGYEIDIDGVLVNVNCVLDSRPPRFLQPEKNQSLLYQSFFGWEIETTDAVFDTSTAVLMDFNLKPNGFCEFMYVLPFTENRALIELTRFGKEKMSESHAIEVFNEYIKEKSISYKIVEKEKGIIPMSSCRMEKNDFGHKWIHTGTAAGLLKPSTGYAFYAMAEDAVQLADSLKSGQQFHRVQPNTRFQFYDRLLLKILEKSPEKGKFIFEQLFKNVPLNDVLTFLNEKTKASTEITIFSKLPKKIFTKTAINDIVSRTETFSPSIIALVFCVFSCLLYACGLYIPIWALLGIGFMTIGLSHGSLDHLDFMENKSSKQLVFFIARYLSLATICAVGWYFFPDIALIVFILYSALHFGETDFTEWKFNSVGLSFLWGLSVLLLILMLHFQETILILQQIPNIKISDFLQHVSDQNLLMAKVIVILVALFWPIYLKHRSVYITIVFLFLSACLPLLISFGIYFVFQHSIQGWKHLKTGLKKESNELWLQSLPFVIAATIIIFGGLLILNKNMWGFFFVMLSCISMPHVLSMNKFYVKHKAST